MTASKSKTKPKKEIEEDEDPNFDEYELDPDETAVMELMYNDLGRYEDLMDKLTKQLGQHNQNLNIVQNQIQDNQTNQFKNGGAIAAMQKTIAQYTGRLNEKYGTPSDVKYEWDRENSKFKKVS